MILIIMISLYSESGLLTYISKIHHAHSSSLYKEGKIIYDEIYKESR